MRMVSLGLFHSSVLYSPASTLIGEAMESLILKTIASSIEAGLKHDNIDVQRRTLHFSQVLLNVGEPLLSQHRATYG